MGQQRAIEASRITAADLAVEVADTVIGEPFADAMARCGDRSLGVP
jgi:hypothetical protein